MCASRCGACAQIYMYIYTYIYETHTHTHTHTHTYIYCCACRVCACAQARERLPEILTHHAPCARPSNIRIHARTHLERERERARARTRASKLDRRGPSARASVGRGKQRRLVLPEHSKRQHLFAIRENTFFSNRRTHSLVTARALYTSASIRHQREHIL